MKHTLVVQLLLCGLLSMGGPACVREHPVSPPFSTGPSSPPDVRRYDCTFTRVAPVIDGEMAEDAWSAATWSEDFVDIEGESKPAPKWQTNFKMLWNRDYLFIAAHLTEPHVCAALREHDSIVFHDNDFEIFIDPDGDSRNYFEIEINALCTVFDLLLERAYRDGGPAHHEWNLEGLLKAVHVYGSLNKPDDGDHAWVVEMAIPWSGLARDAGRAVPPTSGDRWRLNFSRVEWPFERVDGVYRRIESAPENNWVWSPQGVVDMHRPERWGVVEFVDARPATASVNEPEAK